MSFRLFDFAGGFFADCEQSRQNQRAELGGEERTTAGAAALSVLLAPVSYFACAPICLSRVSESK